MFCEGGIALQPELSCIESAVQLNLYVFQACLVIGFITQRHPYVIDTGFSSNFPCNTTAITSVVTQLIKKLILTLKY